MKSVSDLLGSGHFGQAESICCLQSNETSMALSDEPTLTLSNYALTVNRNYDPW